MKFRLLIFLSLVLINELSAEQCFLDSVHIEIKNISQEKLIKISLGYYYGSSRQIKETLNFDSQGTTVFTGALHEGIYFIVMPDTSFYEFMITRGKEYKLLISQQKKQYSYSLIANEETVAFSLFNHLLFEFETANDSLHTALAKSVTKEENLLVLEKIKENTLDFEKKRNKYLEEYRNSFFGKYLLSQQTSVIPTNMIFADSSDQNIFIQKFDYYRDHYFDNIDWADCRMAYTPVLMEKVETFLFKVVPKNIEAQCNALDYLFNLPKNDILKKCLFEETLSLFKRSSYKPIHEYLYGYLIENYFLNGYAGWSTTENIVKLNQELNRIKPVLLNSKSPECNLVDLSGSLINFPYISPSNLTVLVFWDLDCPNCKRILSDLKKIMGKYEYLHPDIFSIYTGDNEDQWRMYSSTQLPPNWVNTKEAIEPASRIYNINTLPSLFLLNSKSKIINKNFTVAELDTWLLNYSTSHK